MKLSYKLAAAFFCVAAGISVAAALPGLTAGLAVGIALIFIGTVLVASGAGQGSQCLREMRREEQERLQQRFVEMQETVKQLDDDLNRYRKEQQAAHEQAGEAQRRLMEQLAQLAETADMLERSAASSVAYAQEQGEQLAQLNETITNAVDRLRSTQKDNLKGITASMEGMRDDILDRLDELNEGVKDLPDTLEEQNDRQIEEIEKLLGDVVRTGLKDMETEVGDLRKELSEQLDQAAAVVEAFRATTKMLGDDLKTFNAKSETALENANKKTQEQLQALQTFLKEENENNRNSTEQIMQMYAALSEQDLRLFESLGVKGGK